MTTHRIVRTHAVESVDLALDAAVDWVGQQRPDAPGVLNLMAAFVAGAAWQREQEAAELTPLATLIEGIS